MGVVVLKKKGSSQGGRKKKTRTFPVVGIRDSRRQTRDGGKKTVIGGGLVAARGSLWDWLSEGGRGSNTARAEKKRRLALRSIAPWGRASRKRPTSADNFW